MANIFRSKDIYKRAPKIPSSEDPLRIVKGLYVVGDYKPPYYIGPCLHITDIKTNKATVVDYTTKSMSYEDHVVNLLGISTGGALKITNYTRASVDLQPDHVVNLIGIIADSAPLNIVYFTRDSKDLNNDHVVNLIGINADTSPLDIVYFSTKRYPSNPEPMLRIKSITTNKATISDV